MKHRFTASVFQTRQTKRGTTDAQVDALVYELYGVTEEEVKVMEGRLDRESRESK